MTWLEQIKWTNEGLVPVIVQEENTHQVLMFAWMNREALTLTIENQRAVYRSRSRQKLWFKGEESNNVQLLKDIRLDCDNDVILLTVEQLGGIACHTGRHSCFFQQLQNDKWVTVEAVLKDPKLMYGTTKN
jgi:phosphoribosyl-AMP cyclohydrolase